MPFIPALRLLSLRPVWSRVEFQDSHSFTVNPCPKTQQNRTVTAKLLRKTPKIHAHNSTAGQAMVAHIFNPSTQETEAGGSTELLPGQLVLLHRETLSGKSKNKQTNKKTKL